MRPILPRRRVPPEANGVPPVGDAHQPRPYLPVWHGSGMTIEEPTVELFPVGARNRPGVRSLWRDREFLKLWAGQTASQFGGQSGQLTLALIAVVSLHVESEQIGLLRAAQQAPIFLFALFVGVWVDRFRVRKVMIVADFGRALAFAALPIAYLFGVLGMSTLYIVAFLVGVCTIFFDVAYQAYLLRLVSREHLAQGNSMLESTRSAAQIGGPAMGGALASLLAAPVAMAVSTGLFLLSCVSIGGIRRPEPAPVRPAKPAGMVRQIGQGLRIVVQDAPLSTIAVTACLFNVFFSALMTAYLIFMPRELNLSASAIGMCLAALGPGALVGSLLSARLPRRFGYGLVLVAASTIADGTMLFIGLVRGSGTVTIILLMAINFTFGVFAQLVNVAMTAVRQAITADLFQGRVSATIRFSALGLTPFGSMLGGYLGAEIGLRVTMLVTAGGLCLSPLILAMSPLARLGRELPSPPAATSGVSDVPGASSAGAGADRSRRHRGRHRFARHRGRHRPGMATAQRDP